MRTIQKLSLILLVFANTQTYGTSNIMTIGDLPKVPVRKNMNTPYDKERKQKKEKLHQQLLVKAGYNKKMTQRNELKRQVLGAIRVKRIMGGKISKEDQEVLSRDRVLGKEIQDIEQNAEQEVAREFPYSGQAGHYYDVAKGINKEGDAKLTKMSEETNARFAEMDEEMASKFAKAEERTDAKLTKMSEEINAGFAEMEREREIRIQNRNEEKVRERELLKRLKAEEKKEEEEFLNQLRAREQAQEELSNNNSNSNEMSAGHDPPYPSYAMLASTMGTSTFMVPIAYVCYYYLCPRGQRTDLAD